MPLPAAERRWAWSWALLVMVAASLPYLLLLAITPPGRVFWGFVNNPDDHCVYLAWMRQAADGHFFFRNLFTGDRQSGLTVNLFFWALGTFARFTHLPLAIVYHLARFGFGTLLLVLVYHLAAFVTEDRRSRRAAFGFVAVSAGLGWLIWPGTAVTDPLHAPVDTWQPEAITFLSLYANALFCAAMAAMVGIFLLLLAAERGGKLRPAVYAGLLLFLLGNFHSYDVITVAVVWSGYLFVMGLLSRRLPIAELRQGAVAAAIGLPAVLYQYYLLRTDPVFQARAAVETPSPVLWCYLLGYGFLLPMGFLGAGCLIVRGFFRRPGALFPIVWAVIGFTVIYIPVSFQRKLAEGLHLPLALLAGLGAVELARRVKLRPAYTPALVGLLLLLTVPTNARFVARDWNRAIHENVGSTGLHLVFWPGSELEAMRRLREWVPRDALIQALPPTSCLIPAMSGRRVWAGHWGETPDFGVKYGPVVRFFSADTPSDWRRQFLAQTGITHIFAGPDERALAKDSLGHEPFLHLLHRLGDTWVYEVVPDGRVPRLSRAAQE
jgi:hypothetical protein